MRPRVYIDTSVIGGYFDEEFKAFTRLLFKRIEKGDFEVFFSDVIEAELELAPQHIREIVDLIPPSCKKLIKIDDDVENLAQTYIAEKVLGQKCAH